MRSKRYYAEPCRNLPREQLTRKQTAVFSSSTVNMLLSDRFALVDVCEYLCQSAVLLRFFRNDVGGHNSTFERIVEGCRLGSTKSVVTYFGDAGVSSLCCDIFVEDIHAV